MINMGPTDNPTTGIQNTAFLPEPPPYSALPSTTAPPGGQQENAVSAPQSVPCTGASDSVQNDDQTNQTTTSASVESPGEVDRALRQVDQSCDQERSGVTPASAAPAGAHERKASQTSPEAHYSTDTLDVESGKRKEVIAQPTDNSNTKTNNQIAVANSKSELTTSNQTPQRCIDSHSQSAQSGSNKSGPVDCGINAVTTPRVTADDTPSPPSESPTPVTTAPPVSSQSITVAPPVSTQPGTAVPPVSSQPATAATSSEG